MSAGESGAFVENPLTEFVFHPPAWRRRFNVDQFDYGAVCSRMAEQCAGMSGREISKLGVAWQAAVYASAEGRLTEQMVLERCEAAVQQHRQKMAWLSEQEKSDHKSITGATIPAHLQKLPLRPAAQAQKLTVLNTPAS